MAPTQLESQGVVKVKTLEILAFIREACEEKQDRENNLSLREWRSVETMLDYIDELVEYAVKQAERGVYHG